MAMSPSAAERTIKEIIGLMAYDDQFNFYVLMKMFRSASETIPTMAVAPDGTRINLYYNLEFMGNLTPPMIQFVLRHEVGHVTLQHISSRCSNDPKRKKLENMGQDLAINCLLPNTTGCHPPKYWEDIVDPMTGEVVHKKGDRMGLFPEDYGFPNKLTAEEYMKLLEEKFKDTPEDKIPGAGSGDLLGGGFDEHGDFKDNPDLAAKIRNIVKTIERNNMWGNTSSDMKEAVKKAQSKEVPWWNYLRFRLGNFISAEKVTTRRKFHRRLGHPFYGYTFQYMGAVDVYVDTSASVGTDELAKFVSEIERLQEYMPIRLWFFDSAMQNPLKPETFHMDRIKEIKFTGRGGTNFQAAIDHAVKNRATNVVIMSDGECDKPNVPGFLELLWVITPGHDGALKGWPGKVVYMKKMAGTKEHK
jgi:predicted metal-dependent peptidase